MLVRMSVEGRMMERSGTMMNQGVVEGRKGGAMILWCFVDMRGKYRGCCCSMRNLFAAEP